MKIAGMVLWVLTAGIGGYLLAVGFAAQRARPSTAVPSTAVPSTTVPSTAVPQDESVIVSSAGVVGVVPEAGVRPTNSRAEIEGSPLLEFVHPALALTGLTLWIFYTVSGYRVFAWVGFGIVVATVLAGVGWVLMTRGAERRRAEGSGFPDHLVLLHGAAALCTIALVAVCLFAVVHL